jgi:transposase
LLQPVQVRAYALFRLKRAKNDKIDATLIAECAKSAPLRAAPDPRLQAMLEPLTLIEQIEEDLVRMKTRRETFRQPRHRALVEAEIARLKRWRAAEIAQLAKEVHSHPDLARRMMLIQSVPGVGRRTALALLVRMPELGTLSREQAAALAGLAPFDRDSGNSRRQRRIQGGRARLRKSLYAAALPAAFRWNAALIATYQRLTKAGKAHKQALVACARKLLLYVNTTVARNTPWVPQPIPLPR